MLQHCQIQSAAAISSCMFWLPTAATMAAPTAAPMAAPTAALMTAIQAHIAWPTFHRSLMGAYHIIKGWQNTFAGSLLLLLYEYHCYLSISMSIGCQHVCCYR